MPRKINLPVVQPDAVLAAVVGAAPLTRAEITKRLWAYIKEHKLHVGRTIYARHEVPGTSAKILDERLLALFDGVDSVGMFELPRCVSRHVAPVGGR